MFAPISSIVQDQYGVSAFAVDSLSMVFMATYILFAIPALRVMENSGLRGGILVGMTLTSIGGWLRVIIGGYFGVIFGQTIISLGQLPLLGAPPKLSATWFGANGNELHPMCFLFDYPTSPLTQSSLSTLLVI
jgi:hypothetical protein